MSGKNKDNPFRIEFVDEAVFIYFFNDVIFGGDRSNLFLLKKIIDDKIRELLK